MTFSQLAIFNLALGAIASFTITATHAGCFEHVGCTDKDYFSKQDLYRLGCDQLELLRNGIYAERGYCFNKPDYELFFGNRKCRYKRPDEVPLNRTERHNVSAIAAAERDRGCR